MCDGCFHRGDDTVCVYACDCKMCLYDNVGEPIYWAIDVVNDFDTLINIRRRCFLKRGYCMFCQRLVATQSVFRKLKHYRRVYDIGNKIVITRRIH